MSHRQFHTPPMDGNRYDVTQSIKESVKPNGNDEEDEMSKEVKLSAKEIQDATERIVELPVELLRLIDEFIDDLKQPKYETPLSIVQLAGIFQNFYHKFDQNAFNYLNHGNIITPSMSGNFLSGIFARSRSNSGATNRRSTDSLGTTPMLSPEEIGKQLKRNELNNIKIDKYMELCEEEIFQKILRKGIEVVPCDSGGFSIKRFFQNSPEYIEFNKLMNVKLSTLHKCSQAGQLNLQSFLQFKRGKEISPKMIEMVHEMVFAEISPYGKMQKLLAMHDWMVVDKEMSNDEFLSLLIYYVVQSDVKDIWITTQFMRLFRYKKRLVMNELYVLTNLEASLFFVESLTKQDFQEEGMELDLPNDLFDVAISEKVRLKKKENNSNNNNNNNVNNRNSVGRNNSYDTLKVIFDSSLRNIVGRFKTAYYLNGENVAKYKDHRFEDLTVRQLQEVFDLYKELLNRAHQQCPPTG